MASPLTLPLISRQMQPLVTVTAKQVSVVLFSCSGPIPLGFSIPCTPSSASFVLPASPCTLVPLFSPSTLLLADTRAHPLPSCRFETLLRETESFQTEESVTQNPNQIQTQYRKREAGKQKLESNRRIDIARNKKHRQEPIEPKTKEESAQTDEYPGLPPGKGHPTE